MPRRPRSPLTPEQSQPAGPSQLEIIPLGRVDDMTLSVMAAHVQAILGLNTRIQVPLPEPEYAFLPRRGQFDAGKIIRRLSALESDPLKLGVAQVDICTPILTFVFGESQVGGKVALVSLHRITGEAPQTTYTRAAKIGLHEIGHLLGIPHCPTPDCLMGFSSNLEKLDRLPLRLCQACEYEARRSLSRRVQS